MILQTGYDYSTVTASVIIAIWTSYVALETASRIEAHCGLKRITWTWITAFCLGGGIWAMHFVAMLAFVIPLQVAYNVPVTALSLALPIFAAAISLFWVQRLDDLGWGPTVATGTLLGIAIVAMHYTGMEAMHGAMTMVYDFRLVLLSFLIAIVGSVAAVRMAFYRTGSLRRAIGAILLGLGISSMHYTGMAALTLYAGNGHGDLSGVMMLDTRGLSLSVTAVTALILSWGWIAAVSDSTSRG